MADIRTRCLVISQPMYFPWVGMLEQIRLADHFVYYDDVQFSRGGFSNRVQIKTRNGIRWLTVPLADQKLGQLINEVRIDDRVGWRRSHVDQLKQAYDGAPFRSEMLSVVDQVFSTPHQTLADLAQASMDALVRYYPQLGARKPFTASSTLGIPGASTQRVIDLCLALQADHYLTGHGARHYLDHQVVFDFGRAVGAIFRRDGIQVGFHVQVVAGAGVERNSRQARGWPPISAMPLGPRFAIRSKALT